MSPVVAQTPAVALVVAMDRRGVIGAGGRLPWHLPDELRRFREITWGHPLLMGRRTHESIGRALPGRRNIVLTRRGAAVAPGCERARSIDEALALAAGEPELMVIGGAEVFAATLPLARRLYLTEVDAEVEGDVCFPPWDRGQWREVAAGTHPRDARHPYAWRWRVLER